MKGHHHKNEICKAGILLHDYSIFLLLINKFDVLHCPKTQKWNSIMANENVYLTNGYFHWNEHFMGMAIFANDTSDMMLES